MSKDKDDKNPFLDLVPPIKYPMGGFLPLKEMKMTKHAKAIELARDLLEDDCKRIDDGEWTPQNTIDLASALLDLHAENEILVNDVKRLTTQFSVMCVEETKLRTENEELRKAIADQMKAGQLDLPYVKVKEALREAANIIRHGDFITDEMGERAAAWLSKFSSEKEGE